jgi:hypothetical protein
LAWLGWFVWAGLIGLAWLQIFGREQIRFVMEREALLWEKEDQICERRGTDL